MKKKIRRFFVKILTVILTFALIIVILTGFLQYFEMADISIMQDVFELAGIEPETDESNDEFRNLTGEFTDIVITDENSAILAAQEAAEGFGLGEAAEDLSLENVSAVENRVYYRLQQNYDGIPVYGRTMIVIADSNGKALGFTTNAININNSFNVETVTQEEIQSSVEAYFSNDNNSYTDVRIENSADDNRIIYLYGDSAIYAYRLNVYFGDASISSTNVIVNANTGKVITVETSIYADSADCYDAEGGVKALGYYDSDLERYELYNMENGILIHSYENTDSSSEESTATFITSDNEIFGDTDEEQNLEASKGLRLLSNTLKVCEYYKNVLGENGYDTNYFFYNDAWDSGENARGGNAELETGEEVGYLSMGSVTGVECMDTIAHEYTHIISRKIVNWVGIESNTEMTDEPGAIDEGYSDIFGEIIESYINGQEPNWSHRDRIISDPMSGNYPAAVGDKKYEKIDGDEWGMWISGNWLLGGDYEDYSHGFSTIISHCAYLMYTGLDGTYAKFSRDELACLWYNTLLVLPSNCTFTALREYMEMTGEILELDDSQKECISAAFAAAGIRDQEESGTYHTDSSLFVYDAKGDLYDNYTVSITGEEYTGIFKWGWFKSDFSLSRTVTTPNEVPVILPKGNYTIVITDNNEETLSQSRDVQIRPNSKNKEILFVTKFGGSEESLQSTAEYVPSKEEEVFKTSDLPDEAVEFNSHYYYVYDLDTVTTWKEAKEYCESQGGYLATITSQEEDEFVYSCLRNKFDCESAYFGFTDQNEEGTWVWANGEVSSYTNWHSGEPNSENPSEDFAMYYYKYSDGSWNDGDFGDRTVNSGRAFICEWGDYNTSNTISMSNITSVKASSSLSEYGMTHFPEYSIDNDVTTGWVEGVEGQGEGESLEFVFDNIYLVSGINIRAGYHKSESLFEKNSKPALIKIVFSDGSYQEYELKESFSNQKINFTQAKETTSITIVIESVYPGSEFEDTVISEIELY